MTQTPESRDHGLETVDRPSGIRARSTTAHETRKTRAQSDQEQLMQKMQARRWIGPKHARFARPTLDGYQCASLGNVARNGDQSGSCGLRNLLALDGQKLAHASALVAAGAVLFVRRLTAGRLVVIVRATPFVLAGRLVRDDVASRAVLDMTPAAPQGAVCRHDDCQQDGDCRSHRTENSEVPHRKTDYAIIGRQFGLM
jgi:hypothetical protein